MSGTADFFGLKISFLRHLGVRTEAAEGGRSRISLKRRRETRGKSE